jgi:hypothetical protein
MDKTKSFIIELEKFIDEMNANISVEEVKLQPIFYSVVGNLEKLDDDFSIEKGMDLKRHIKVQKTDGGESEIYLSELLQQAIKMA